MKFAIAATVAAAGLAAAAPATQSKSEILARAKGVYKRHLEGGSIEAQKLAKRQSNSSSGITDNDILNFALQLEYLEAQYYHIAAYGTQLDQSLLNGTGTRGYIQNNAGAQVPFQSSLVQQYAQEIAGDEMHHVAAIRSVLGANAVAQPAINLNESFTAAAQAAGIINSTQQFNPFSSDAFFLLGAFLFEDLGVTAYNGAATLIQNKDVLQAAAGILAVEAYHAGAIRANLIAAAQNITLVETAANAAAAAISSLGGGKDEGIIVNGKANVVNADNQTSIAFTRTPGQVLNVAYLGTGANGGGFFPNGLNGNIKTATNGTS